jgi:hypothetical protein
LITQSDNTGKSLPDFLEYYVLWKTGCIGGCVYLQYWQLSAYTCSMSSRMHLACECRSPLHAWENPPGSITQHSWSKHPGPTYNHIQHFPL